MYGAPEKDRKWGRLTAAFYMGYIRASVGVVECCFLHGVWPGLSRGG